MSESKKKSPVFLDGRRGVSRVRVFKHRKSERYFLEWYVKVPGLRRPKPVTRSLGEMRLAEAKKEATKKADELLDQHQKGETVEGLRERVESASAGSGPSADGVAAKRSSAQETTRPLTIDRLMELFIDGRTRAGTIRPLYQFVRARLNAAMHGADLLVEELDDQQIAEYVQSRRKGGIVIPKSDGQAKAGATRTLGPVRNRAIEEDLTVLRSAILWATRKKVRGGTTTMLDRSPITKWPKLVEANIKRPMLSHEEAATLLVRAWEIRPELWLAIVLCLHTGMRLQSVRQLTWENINFGEATIQWPGLIMKNERELVTPIVPELITALAYYIEQGKGSGTGALFPAPGKQTPRNRYGFYKWWRECLVAAGMPTDKRSGFHSFRRRFASDLAGAPLPVLMALGGWRNPDVVVKIYAEPSVESKRAVLLNRAAFAVGHLTSNRDRVLSAPLAGESSDND